MGERRQWGEPRPLADSLASAPEDRQDETSRPDVQRSSSAVGIEEGHRLVSLDSVQRRQLPQVSSGGVAKVVAYLVVSPADVRARQEDVGEGIEAVRAMLQRSATAGTFTPEKTPEDWEAWQALKARAVAFGGQTVQLDTAIGQYQDGAAILAELVTWHEKAKSFPAPPAPAAMVKAPAQLGGAEQLGGGLGRLFLFYLLWQFALKKGR